MGNIDENFFGGQNFFGVGKIGRNFFRIGQQWSETENSFKSGQDAVGFFKSR